MPSLSPNSWKILCFIIRKTIGWHRKKDRLSWTQIQVGTGIGSRSTIQEGLNELITKGYIISECRKGPQATPYSLNLDFTLEINDPVDNLPSSTETVPPSSTETEPERYSFYTTIGIETVPTKQKTNDKIKREKERSSSSSSPSFQNWEALKDRYGPRAVAEAIEASPVSKRRSLLDIFLMLMVIYWNTRLTVQSVAA